MYHKILFSAAILILGFCFSVNAQDKADTISRDYVVNLKGDTIKGPVLWISDGSLKIDPFSETHTVKYKADEIKEACKTGQVYVPIRVSLTFRDIVIVKRIEHGAINLYEYVQTSYNNSGSQTTWYANKGDGKVTEIKTSGMGGISRAERKKNFLALIADNDQLTKKFQSQDDFSFDVLQDLIRQYNQQGGGKAK